jgi:tripartite-type tricarboxylate transporter receptor subunit TctC
MSFLSKALGAVASAAVCVALAASQAAAQTYPASKITIIVAFAPGGVADTLARFIGQGLSDRLHQPVVVENRGGAGGNIAATIVARAAPDGYTLLATTTAIAVNETLFENKEYTANDLKTVSIAAISPESLVTAGTNPADNLTDFLKSMNGRTINLAVPGVGTGSDIEAEYFLKFLAKAPYQMIPFQGGAPAINATVGGQVDLMASTLGGGAAAQITGGKLKGLGIAAEHRAAVTPNVPTYAEQGFGTFTAASWVGFFAPAKTNPKIVATLNETINAIMQTADVQKKLADMGFDPITGSPEQADTMFTSEIKKWGDMVKALNLSIK